MTNMSIESTVRDVISRHMEVPLEQVTRQASFGHDLGADSLDNVEIIIKLEKAFQIEIPEEQSQRFKTVAMVIDYITSVKRR